MWYYLFIFILFLRWYVVFVLGFEKDYIYFYLNYLFLEVLKECFFGILEIVVIFVGVDVMKEFIFVLLIVYYNMGGIFINYYGEVIILLL